MKKFLAVLMTVIICVAFAGCGDTTIIRIDSPFANNPNVPISDFKSYNKSFSDDAMDFSVEKVVVTDELLAIMLQPVTMTFTPLYKDTSGKFVYVFGTVRQKFSQTWQSSYFPKGSYDVDTPLCQLIFGDKYRYDAKIRFNLREYSHNLYPDYNYQVEPELDPMFDSKFVILTKVPDAVLDEYKSYDLLLSVRSRDNPQEQFKYHNYKVTLN